MKQNDDKNKVLKPLPNEKKQREKKKRKYQKQNERKKEKKRNSSKNIKEIIKNNMHISTQMYAHKNRSLFLDT